MMFHLGVALPPSPPPLFAVFVCRAYSRSELGCIGFHCSPIAGIDFVGVGKAGKGMPSVCAGAAAVMLARLRAGPCSFKPAGGAHHAHCIADTTTSALHIPCPALKNAPALPCPQFATSVMVSGWYQVGAGCCGRPGGMPTAWVGAFLALASQKQQGPNSLTIPASFYSQVQ